MNYILYQHNSIRGFSWTFPQDSLLCAPSLRGFAPFAPLQKRLSGASVAIRDARARFSGYFWINSWKHAVHDLII